MMNSDGSDQQFVGPAPDLHVLGMSLHPDGQTIAFTAVDTQDRDGHEAQIYLVDADGHHLQSLSMRNDTGQPRDIEWSRDGRHLAVTMELQGPGQHTSHLYVVSPDGSTIERVTGDEEWVWNVTWSPDSSHLAFNATRRGEPGGDHRIRILNLDKSETETIMELEDSYVLDLDWSPAGDEMLYLTWESHQSGSLTRMLVANIDGTHSHQITDSRTAATPRWSPFGRRIFFADRRHGSYDLFVINRDGANEQRLTHGEHDIYSPSPSAAPPAAGKRPAEQQVW